MAKSKDLSKYPESYFDLAKAIEERDSFSIEFSSPEVAHSTRFDFWAWRTAFIEQGGKAQYPNLQGAHISRKENVLTFTKKDKTKESLELALGLKALNSVVTETLKSSSSIAPPVDGEPAIPPGKNAEAAVSDWLTKKD